MEQNDSMIRFNWYEHSHRLVIVSVWEGLMFSCAKHCSTVAEGVKGTRVPFTRSLCWACSAVRSRGATESRLHQSPEAPVCCHSSLKSPRSVTAPCPCCAPTLTVGKWSYIGATTANLHCPETMPQSAGLLKLLHANGWITDQDLTINCVNAAAFS